MDIFRVEDDADRTAVFAIGSGGFPFHVLTPGWWKALELAGYTEHVIDAETWDSLRLAVVAYSSVYAMGPDALRGLDGADLDQIRP